MMKDSYGRTIDYMRISITDRCNLRCCYCMPEGARKEPPSQILTFEEILAVVICGAGLGIRHIRLTGGEPLVRKGCAQLVRMLKSVPGIETVTLTTNGILLKENLPALLDAGIDGINVSLDTRDRARYRQITGVDGLETVESAIRAACKCRIPVKVNAVSIDFDRCGFGRGDFEEGELQNVSRQFHLPDWTAVAELARELPVDVRFIEMMPIGYGRQYQTISHEQLLEEMKARYPGLEPDSRRHGAGPAVYYRAPGFQGSLGLISAIHGKFCGNCSRVRLTAEGFLKTCLCYPDGADLRAVLRGPESPILRENGHFFWPFAACPGEEGLQRCLREAMEKAILEKPGAHCFEDPQAMREQRNMIDIGG